MTRNGRSPHYPEQRWTGISLESTAVKPDCTYCPPILPAARTAYLESGDDGDAPQKRRINSAHRRRALELLASDPHGATTKLLVVAYGFDNDMIAPRSRGMLQLHSSQPILDVWRPFENAVSVCRRDAS